MCKLSINPLYLKRSSDAKSYTWIKNWKQQHWQEDVFGVPKLFFKKLKGVVSVLPGYAGGNIENPTYKQVCSGITGHAEAIQIEFNTFQISFEKILDIFMNTHNPTTLNQQGNDIGTQYRSAIFYHNKKQNWTKQEFLKIQL